MYSALASVFNTLLCLLAYNHSTRDCDLIKFQDKLGFFGLFCVLIEKLIGKKAQKCSKFNMQYSLSKTVLILVLWEKVDQMKGKKKCSS